MELLVAVLAVLALIALGPLLMLVGKWVTRLGDRIVEWEQRRNRV